MVTFAEKRELLRMYMSDCNACSPEDADEIADEDLDEWLASHDPNWQMATPSSSGDKA